MNITEAIAVVRQHLDAEDDIDRWTDTQVKSSLGYALNKVQEDYVKSGGRRLDEIVSVTTDSSGRYDISASNPISIKGISILQGMRRWPLTPSQYEEMRYPHQQVSEIEIRFVPKLELSATNSHPLVGSGATAKNTWESFEQLICVTAAMYCAIKDDELRQTLQELEMKLRETVMKEERIPSSYRPPAKAMWLSALVGYVWIPESKEIQLIRRDY